MYSKRPNIGPADYWSLTLGEDRKGRSSAGLQPSINRHHRHHRHHQYLPPLSPLFHHASWKFLAYIFSWARGRAGYARSIQEAHARDQSLMSKSVRNDIQFNYNDVILLGTRSPTASQPPMKPPSRKPGRGTSGTTRRRSHGRATSRKKQVSCRAAKNAVWLTSLLLVRGAYCTCYTGFSQWSLSHLPLQVSFLQPLLWLRPPQ